MLIHYSLHVQRFVRCSSLDVQHATQTVLVQMLGPLGFGLVLDLVIGLGLDLGLGMGLGIGLDRLRRRLRLRLRFRLGLVLSRNGHYSLSVQKVVPVYVCKLLHVESGIVFAII